MTTNENVPTSGRPPSKPEEKVSFSINEGQGAVPFASYRANREYNTNHESEKYRETEPMGSTSFFRMAKAAKRKER